MTTRADKVSPQGPRNLNKALPVFLIERFLPEGLFDSSDGEAVSIRHSRVR